MSAITDALDQLVADQAAAVAPIRAAVLEVDSAARSQLAAALREQQANHDAEIQTYNERIDGLLRRVAELEAQRPERRLWGFTQADLEALPGGPLSVASWEKLTGQRQSTTNLRFMSLVDTPDAGRALRHLIPKGLVTGTAIGFRFPDGAKVDRLGLRFHAVARAPWPTGQLPLGGKLLGILAALDGTRIDAATGGDFMYDKAASLRLKFAEYLRGETYPYGVGQMLRPADAGGTARQGACYGDELYWAGKAKNLMIPGQLQTFDVRGIMNTPGEADGRIVTTLDGKPMLDVPFEFRSRADLQWGGIAWSLFAGGKDPAKYAVTTDRLVDVTEAEAYEPRLQAA